MQTCLIRQILSTVIASVVGEHMLDSGCLIGCTVLMGQDIVPVRVGEITIPPFSLIGWLHGFMLQHADCVAHEGRRMLLVVQLLSVSGVE